MFERGSLRQCHSVIIIQDNDCESIRESFTAVLTLVSGFDVTINPNLTRIDIRDVAEPECGKT